MVAKVVLNVHAKVVMQKCRLSIRRSNAMRRRRRRRRRRKVY